METARLCSRETLAVGPLEENTGTVTVVVSEPYRRSSWVRETGTVIDEGRWKQVWVEMTDSNWKTGGVNRLRL